MNEIRKLNIISSEQSDRIDGLYRELNAKDKNLAELANKVDNHTDNLKVLDSKIDELSLAIPMQRLNTIVSYNAEKTTEILNVNYRKTKGEGGFIVVALRDMSMASLTYTDPISQSNIKLDKQIQYFKLPDEERDTRLGLGLVRCNTHCEGITVIGVGTVYEMFL